MDCSICDGHGDILAHEYVMSPMRDYWRVMSPNSIPDHMKRIVTVVVPGGICMKKCLCCDGTGKSKVK